ncbi:cysteine proteinase [Pholiota conissans]|uniref:ubiquitinyl hydrolase 1 n=1 Tax=Pholiota conissans TaxID=109636 RepID=A0A9P6CUR1_9AGAR|nr:cysteine proteinase [Pholiota conissans]
MTSHPAYPHAAPGPSSYYQQPPPPHHVYGSHSPGPRQNYYPYPGPPPPMNSHHPAQYHHQPGPSRGNNRGANNLGGSYNSRGTHHYHNYQQPHQPHQPHFAHTHVNPALAVHTQHSPQHMYSPQAAKYNQAYTPSYPYPSPTAPVFTPSWQQQQPISPLPKQLSMPPPQNIPQTFYEPPSAPPPTERVVEAPSPSEPAEKLETLVIEEKIEADTSSIPVPATLVTPESTSILQTSSYAQMGTISTTDATASSPTPSRTVSPSPGKTAVNPIAKWAIWSRRPQDPSHAPSIIISPRARPPPDVVQQAFDQKTPPPSAPSSPIHVIAKSLPPTEVHFMQARPSTSSAVAELSFQSSDEIGATSQTESSVPSSSVTENADTPTAPGSPASSHTSVSISGTLMKELTDIPVEDDATKAEPAPAVGLEEHESSVPSTSTSTVSVTELASAQPEILANPIVATPPIVTPTPAASTPPPKKSWASLLRPTSSPSSTPAPRNALPTSSVVGFSIPAATPTPAVPVSPTKKSELVMLLTSGPAAPATGFAAAAAGATSTGAAAAMKIRPRGLVNSGNMCFANSVLQVLVYCTPFHRLFVELGKVLTGPVVGPGIASAPSASASASAGAAAKDDATKASTSATPLVDATVEFLREFIEEKKRKSDKARLEVVGRNGGSSGGNGGRGKGKEREAEAEEDNGDWDGDSFLPTYVYDAMKEKKRFDNMRGGHQEDAEEFFGFYLDTLEEELLAILHSISPPKPTKAHVVEEVEEAAPPPDDGWLEVGKRNRMVITRTNKATESPITRIFGGKFRATLRAPGQKDSVVIEEWRSLRLDIQPDQIHTIQDALSYISHPQPVQISQPGKPGVTVDGQRQELIEALPPILVLHIKRFFYDPAQGGAVKVGKQVQFGPELEIGADVMVPAARKAQPARYKLFGALYHHGLSASGGHYTLDVLHPNRYPSANPVAKPREGWVRIDDDLVSDVRPEDVFGASERDDSRCAYLLFYRRI